MKFGQTFVIPASSSSLSHKPLKLTKTKPLECLQHPSFTLPKNSQFWSQKGESLLSVNLSISLGPGVFGVVCRQRAVARCWERFRVVRVMKGESSW